MQLPSKLQYKPIFCFLEAIFNIYKKHININNVWLAHKMPLDVSYWNILIEDILEAVLEQFYSW